MENYISNCTVMITASTLAFCGLLLWLLLRKEVSEFDLYYGYFLSKSPTSKVLPKHLAIMVSTANGLKDVVSQYQLSSHGKPGKVDKVTYSFIGFSSSVSSIYTYSIDIHSSTHFICFQSTLLSKYYRVHLSNYYIMLLTLLHLHHYSYIIRPTPLNLHQLHYYLLITSQAFFWLSTLVESTGRDQWVYTYIV